MQNQKKTLWLTALAGALTIAFASGCPDDDKSTSPSGSPSPSPSASGVDVKVHEWKQIKSLAANFRPTGDNVAMLAVSGDSKWLYAANSNQLFAGDVAKFDEVGDDSKWAPVGLGAAGLGGLTAGTADMTAAITVNQIVPTSDGVLVSRSAAGLADHADNGAAYLKGKTWTSAWSSDSTPRHMVVGVAADEYLWVGVAKVPAGEIPVLFNSKTTNFGVTDERAAGLSRVKLDRTFKSHTTNTFGGHPFLAMAGDDAYVVDSAGIHKFTAANLVGAGNKAGDAQVVAATANTGSNGWRQDGATGNADVKAIAVANGKLYIALDAPLAAANRGGVAVYNIGAPGISKPDAAWSTIAVLALAVDSKNNVWAVTKDGLFEAKDDGKKGAKLTATNVPATPADATANSSYDKNGSLLPTSNITDAKFVGDNLVIATNGGGLVVRFAATAHKIK